ncbi:hypothetical protein TgHK011_008902 [Trichoderma gracile]|nr:hypothetical protein TgHK011_008902 [Trichoderma gracile]
MGQQADATPRNEALIIHKVPGKVSSERRNTSTILCTRDQQGGAYLPSLNFFLRSVVARIWHRQRLGDCSQPSTSKHNHRRAMGDKRPLKLQCLRALRCLAPQLASAPATLFRVERQGPCSRESTKASHLAGRPVLLDRHPTSLEVNLNREALVQQRIPASVTGVAVFTVRHAPREFPGR